MAIKTMASCHDGFPLMNRRSTLKQSSLLLLGCLIASACLDPARAQAPAADCPGHPDALGTSRTIVVDPTEHTRIGTMQYNETLPLNDHEVVLTFDDGPLPAHTNPILDILAAQCIKATFFMVGRMAQVYPQDVRRVYDAGHSIGTHSQNHPLHFGDLPPDRMSSEIEDAITNVGNALGDPAKISPFFRVPGLRRGNAVEAYLGKRGIMTWSADFPPMTGGTSPRHKSSTMRCRGWKPKAKAFCCCTTFRREPRLRYQ